jgi:hypothetical protein
MIRFSFVWSILIALSLATPAMAAFQSQTFIPFSNFKFGILPSKTLDTNFIWSPSAGRVKTYELKNYPTLIDRSSALLIKNMGANFGLTKDGVMVTVDEFGYFYNYGKTKFVPAVLGGNYLINKSNSELIIIDSEGLFYSTGIQVSNVRLFGGNFFIDQSGNLTTIKAMGASSGNSSGMITVKYGWSFNDAVRAGGNFFVKNDGTVVGVNSENGFFTEPQKVDSLPEKIGGNYFIGKDGILYTVSHLGIVQKQQPILGAMKYFGYSYMVAPDDYFIFIDGAGVPYTNVVNRKEYGMHREVTQIRDPIDMNVQTFIKGAQ